MIRQSLIELTKCRLREFIREPSASFFVIFMPIVWMVILGLAFSPQKKEIIIVGVVNNVDNLASSLKLEQFIKELKKSKEIELVQNTKENLTKKLRLNKLSLILNLNKGYLQYTYDPTNPKSLTHRHLVDNFIQTSFGRNNPIRTQDLIYTPPGNRYIDFLIPGLLALSLLTTSLFGTGMVIVVSRREKLLQRFLVTPMKPIDYFLSHIIGRLLIVLLEVFVILLAGYLIFSFSIRGSLLDYFTISFLGASCFTSLALLCSSRGKNSSAYSGFANLIVIFLMLFSGIWFTRNNFPTWLQDISHYSPLSALVDSLRRISLEGDSIFFLHQEITLLVLYTVIFLLLSKKTFKWL